MRIVDKERDYYDVGQGLGYDPRVVYVRARKEVELEQRYYNEIYVGFCGEIYHGFLLDYYHAPWNTKSVTPTYCYRIEEVDRWVDEYYDPDERDFYHSRGKAKYRSGLVVRKDLAKLLEKGGFAHHKSIFAEYNTPIFVVDYAQKKLFINPLLRPYQFQKVKEPYTAYQEIEQYVGGVLVSPVPPIPSIADDVMVEIKGFDPKWGFRKGPRGKR